MKPSKAFRNFSTTALVCSLTLALTPVCWGQNSFFLSVHGVQGESTADRHAGDIDATGFSFTVSNGGGAAPSFGDLIVTKVVDKASPPLMLRCAQGTVISSVVLFVQQPSQTYDYYKVILTNARVRSVATDGSVGDNLTEKVTFTYERIEIIYTPRGLDGPGAPIDACWDRLANAPC